MKRYWLLILAFMLAATVCAVGVGLAARVHRIQVSLRFADGTTGIVRIRDGESFSVGTEGHMVTGTARVIE